MITESDLETLKKLYGDFVVEILGLQSDNLSDVSTNNEVMGEVVDFLLKLRIEAKSKKDWVTADGIRTRLTELGFVIKDTKDGFDWELKK